MTATFVLSMVVLVTIVLLAAVLNRARTPASSPRRGGEPGSDVSWLPAVMGDGGGGCAAGDAGCGDGGGGGGD